MLQSLATLIFAASAFSAVAVIAALLDTEWDNVCQALGLVRRRNLAPLPPRIHTMPARPVPMLRVIPGAMRRAA